MKPFQLQVIHSEHVEILQKIVKLLFDIRCDFRVYQYPNGFAGITVFCFADEHYAEIVDLMFQNIPEYNR